ncbi:MAG: XRE family transcriptional regulator [Richelia sp. RM2_1_2]|nr:XRE family transcriptional regulator [Richelia sp. SM1_7_0]NJN11383.1 XRE family transcriptional regulator [Richelia sp. RM1_1_1]NJO28904.1 XRE family transcriptional regulator [Richelia sp. SL_2_1]NJO64597.1 XRE family transcriptional regulator [Richelia sp. RM2_1_2]
MQEIVTKGMETHQRLFDEMLERFDISAKEIAQLIGVSEVTLSRFRRGRGDLLTTKFLALLLVLPEDAREWYISRLVGSKPKINLRSLVMEASPQEKAEVLNALAAWVVQSREYKDSSHLAQAV